MGGALGVLGVGYAGRSQRRMRRVNRSAARLSSGGIGDLRVECVKEVSGRVSFSIWGAGAPWERPPTDYLKQSTTFKISTSHKDTDKSAAARGPFLAPLSAASPSHSQFLTAMHGLTYSPGNENVPVLRATRRTSGGIAGWKP